MPSKIYRQILNDRIDTFLRDSKSAELVNHLGLRGEIRESGLGKLIADLLPVDWGIGSGKIIDSNDKQSSETDLIIYYKKIFPPIFYKEDKGIFPLESCGFAFEIKTKSNSTEIKSTIEKFNKLKTMEIIRPWSDEVPEYRIKPIRVYFALDTDLREESELDRYIKYDSESKYNPAIQIICIVGKGVWFFHNEEDYDDEPTTYWNFSPNKGNHEELIILFGTIINQIISIVTFGGLDMKRYLIEQIDEIMSRKIIRK